MSVLDEATDDEATDPDLARAQGGDGAAFDRLVAPLRAELHAHCYRMLGSTHDADDALQDALVRAWRPLAGFQGRSSLRAWLYTVATRTCVDDIARRGRRALPVDLGPASEQTVVGDAPLTDVAWLGPYPGSGPDGAPAGPEARYEQQEAVELAFVAALQRARRLVCERVPARSQQQTLRELDAGRLHPLVSSSAALERGDADGLVALLTEDVTWSMPPLPHWYAGRWRWRSPGPTWCTPSSPTSRRWRSCSTTGRRAGPPPTT